MSQPVIITISDDTIRDGLQLIRGIVAAQKAMEAAQAVMDVYEQQVRAWYKVPPDFVMQSWVEGFISPALAAERAKHEAAHAAGEEHSHGE